MNKEIKKLPIIEKESNEEALKWGRHYKYPQCCINSYIKEKRPVWIVRLIQFPKLREVLIKQKGLGFVPCIRHARMLTNGEMTIKELLKR